MEMWMFLISPHEMAGTFSADSNPTLIIDQLISEIESGRFSTANESLRLLFRQAGFVNLWFFGRFIAGYNGPFERINLPVHKERENLRAAAFLGRGLYKTSIFTELGSAWDLLRNPDGEIILFSAIHDRSLKFMWTVQRIFDGNEFFAWLYPEYVPKKNQKRWNDEEMVLPNRSRNRTGASLYPRGVCCSIQGLHGRIIVDDPIGDTQLDSSKQSNMEMYKIGEWLKSNLDAITAGQADKSVFYTATRYSPDDAHSFIFESIRKRYGYWDEDDEYEVREDGQWVVYNRKTREDGKSIAPEIWPDSELDRIQRENPWMYYTWLQNSPRESGLSELNLYTVKEFDLDYDEVLGWVFKVSEDGKEVVYRMADCDTVQPIDPAASEKRLSARTSRTALGILSRHSSDKRFLHSVRAGFVQPSEWYDWAFSNAKRFNDYLRKTLLEAQGAFKVFDPLLRDEERRREREARERHEMFCSLRHEALTKPGEKDAVIRSTLEPLLKEGLLYVERSVKSLVLEELNAFPQSKRKDILDMWCIGLNGARRPMDKDELYAKMKQDSWFEQRAANVAGY
jgi:hypothetical protein